MSLKAMVDVNKQVSKSNQSIMKVNIVTSVKGHPPRAKPSPTSPLKNTSAANPPVKTDALTNAKLTSSRLSQRSLFTKQPKGLTKAQQAQLDQRFGELSDNVLKVIRTPSPFTKQSLENLLTQQLAKCLGPVVTHPLVTPVFIRATRDLLVSLVREYDEGEVGAHLVLEDSSAEGSFLEADSANTLSYRDRYLKELVVNVLQGLCGHKQEESNTMKMLNEASKEKIQEIRKIVKADLGINPETLEQLEQRLGDLRKTLSLKHLKNKADQDIHIPKPAQQALRLSCAKACNAKKGPLEVNRRTSSMCLINHTVKDGSKVDLQRKESEMVQNVAKDQVLQNFQMMNLENVSSGSDHETTNRNGDTNFCNDKSGYGDSDDEITQEETQIFIEALIADKRRKSFVRNMRTLEVISEEEEIVIESVSLNSGRGKVDEQCCNEPSECDFENKSLVKSLMEDSSWYKANSLQLDPSNFEFLDRKLVSDSMSKMIQFNDGNAQGKLKHTSSIMDLNKKGHFNPDIEETFFLKELEQEKLDHFMQVETEIYQFDFENKSEGEKENQAQYLHNLQRVASNVGLLKNNLVCDISKEMQLVHKHVQMSPSISNNILNIREAAQSETKIKETIHLDKQESKRVEFSLNEVVRILLKVSIRIKELPSYLNDVGVDSCQGKLLVNLFDPYSHHDSYNTMNSLFAEKMSTIYFRLAQILNRTPRMLHREPISALDPPDTLIKNLATIATLDFFKDCFVSSLLELNEEELENITFYDALLEQSKTTVPCSNKTKNHELAMKNSSAYLPDVGSSLALRYAIHKNVTLQEVPDGVLTHCNHLWDLNPDLLTLQNVSDMFLFFSTVLNDVPNRIKSRGILTLNPPSSLLQALNILYAADSPCNPSELNEKNSFASLTLQDAANFFMILSKTLEKTPPRLKNSSISDLDPPESFLKAATLLTSLAHTSVLASESQDEVDSQSSQDYFDAMDYVEFVECV